MLAYGSDAIERDGILIFCNRQAVADFALTEGVLALDPERDQAFSLTRAAAAEIAGRMQLAYVNALKGITMLSPQKRSCRTKPQSRSRATNCHWP